MVVLLRVEQLLGFFKRFIQQEIRMTPRLLDQAIMHINNRDDFNRVKMEALDFI